MHPDMEKWSARYPTSWAAALALPPDEIVELVYAARVHDVGKIFVPNAL